MKMPKVKFYFAGLKFKEKVGIQKKKKKIY